MCFWVAKHPDTMGNFIRKPKDLSENSHDQRKEWRYDSWTLCYVIRKIKIRHCIHVALFFYICVCDGKFIHDGCRRAPFCCDCTAKRFKMSSARCECDHPVVRKILFASSGILIFCCIILLFLHLKVQIYPGVYWLVRLIYCNLDFLKWFANSISTIYGCKR